MCQFESFKNAEWCVKRGECIQTRPNRQPHMGGVDLRGSDCDATRRQGQKEKRGEDDNERRWWEEGCDSVAMDAIQSTITRARASTAAAAVAPLLPLRHRRWHNSTNAATAVLSSWFGPLNAKFSGIYIQW